MAKKTAVGAPAGDHHLVAEFRKAIESKDLVTMGRMLELLGTIRAELLLGKPVLDQLAAATPATTAADASARAALKPSKVTPPSTPAARAAR